MMSCQKILFVFVLIWRIKHLSLIAVVWERDFKKASWKLQPLENTVEYFTSQWVDYPLFGRPMMQFILCSSSEIIFSFIFLKK